MTFSGISQTLAGGPGQAGGTEADTATFTFGNADKVMRDLAADVDLYKASLEFSLFHVATGIKLDLWKGEVSDFQSGSETEFELSAVDGFYDLTLQYPIDRISPTCGKNYDDDQGCPFSKTGGGHTAGELDLINYPAATANTCDHGYLTPNGCKAHTMKRFYGGVLIQPQSVRVKDNTSGFFGFGRPTETATSLVADSAAGQPLAEIYTDVPIPVNALIVSGRDEGDFYNAWGVVGAGPLQAYARGQIDSAGNRIIHTLDGQPNHGDPGEFGIREVLGSDPAGASDFASLDQNGDQTGGDPDKVYSGNSTFLDHFAAGMASIFIRRTDEKGFQLSSLDQHSMQAWVLQGLKGWIWSAAGVRTEGLLVNPIWISVNVALRGLGKRFASAEEAETYFDVDAAIASAAKADAVVAKIIGDGTETQFKFQGVLRDLKVLRDWIQEVLNNALGCWVLSFGKLRIIVRDTADVDHAFSSGNIILNSLRCRPIKPSFNRLTVTFANVDYNFIADTIPVKDLDHIAYLGRTLESTINLAGAAGKSMAARIGSVRLKEELGGVGYTEQKKAREVVWKTTVLALSAEPGQNCSIEDEEIPDGFGAFRLVKWVLNPDFSIDMSGRTVTDSMYSDTDAPHAGPIVSDTPSLPVPVDFYPAPLKSRWLPNSDAPPAGDAVASETDKTFGLAIVYSSLADRGRHHRRSGCIEVQVRN